MHQISARTVVEPFLPALFAYCPTMDLVATTTRKKDNVDVWRLNGQRVFGANFNKQEHEGDEGEGREAEREKDANVRGVVWRRDAGQILAVACSDGTISLINAFTGKIAHRISAYKQHPLPPILSQQYGSLSQPHSRRRSSRLPSQPPLPPTVTSLSWTTHFAYPSPNAVRSNLPTPTSTSLDQILSLRADVEKLLHLQADLPHYLSTVDIETSLPKLATLPPTGVGVDDDVFSSRGSVDVIFHGGGDDDPGGKGGVNVLMVGLSDESGCKVHLRIFDAFEVGTVDVRGVLPEGRAARAVRIESHPFLSTIFLVVEMASANGAGDSSLHLLGLDLSFIPQTGLNLALVSKKATQLGNLLRYISQVQMQLVAEVKAAFDLPTKFLRNVNESLAEAEEGADFVFVAHHLAVTGDCDPKLKEWLVDEVGERGLKRWEKAVGDCFEVVRRMTSECLVPALERCLIVLSRLDGLARFGPTSSKLGLDEKSIAKVTETVDSMGILAEDLLIDVDLEMREFAAFMKWLKWECEVEALEEGSERAAELRESWTGEGELKMVLEYVIGAMKESRLKKYLVKGEEEQPAPGPASFDEDPDIGFFAEYTRRRVSGRKHRKLPTLGDLVGRMQKQCESVFSQIAETFRKSILVSYMTALPQQCDGSKMDIKVIPDETDMDLYRLVALSGDLEEHHRILQVVVTLQQSAAKTFKHTVNTYTLSIPDAQRILDTKFVDNKEFLVLVETASNARIYSHDIMDEDDGALGWRHAFDNAQMKGVRPARLDVNGRVGRRVVAVLDRDGLGYAVFDLDGEDDAADTDGGGDSILTG
ncbi:hypothetical protein A1O7_02230 [Cladophialophora yegresii CBS 114405]|uniref:Anaphase-promoting complex subunit 4 n=1 Tax=Cladophialophora yegresii CBS 114405 TaxID=1182544 RepID=W9W9W4_9EURO|nr:uncharacterized protein A1O7_02230 [Cladophialophora yegresii CBS 114405]EXJ61800.1 hypothetical protein A1O7_02230 [Cladophialophora yegresii CBS 114405]